MPELVETKVLREPWEIEPRLVELGLTRDGLHGVVLVAISEAANATPFHPANAAGTLAYHHGTWALRNTYVGDEWRLDREGGVEAIWNDKLKVRVVFSNVDLACNDDQGPKPRSRKGAGAERLCMSNYSLFGDMPMYTRQPTGEVSTFYLMVDEAGRAELTRPIVKGGTFESYVERIYLIIDGEDDDPAGKLSLDDGDVADGFDPQIVRK
ncbi:hypothetical protein ACO2Q3_10110 [Caulobacter sp. KR2-114]|uniref:hypothetical protein n=1 Tax=Caulobacter sp. KR2-114 TaxID=3400912 RepID=UPI003C0A3874